MPLAKSQPPKGLVPGSSSKYCDLIRHYTNHLALKIKLTKLLFPICITRAVAASVQKSGSGPRAASETEHDNHPE